MARKRVTKFEADLRRAFPDVSEVSMALALALIQAHNGRDYAERNALLDQIGVVAELRRSCYNPPGRTYELMTALNALFGTHGSEPLGEVHMRDGAPFEYLNVGDPYIPTLVRYRSSGRFYVRCYGDLVQAYRIK